MSVILDFGRKLLECAQQGDTEEVKLLVNSGAPFTTDWLGTSPLHVATEHGHVDTVEVLLRAGINHDVRTKVDRTPLHIAAYEGHVRLVELLIKHGAEVNAKDMLLMTPLHWAVECGHISVIKYLLKQNADTKARNKFNKTALDIAEDNHREDIIDVLKDHMNKSFTNDGGENKILGGSLNYHTILPSRTNQFKPIGSERVCSSNSHASEKKNAESSSTVNNSIKVETLKIESVKTGDLPCSVLLKNELNGMEKCSVKTEDYDDDSNISSCHSEKGDIASQRHNSVLTALATLAEATAPNAHVSKQDAVQWLKTIGVDVPSSDNSTIVAAALESGLKVSLTEAGKLAMKWGEQQNRFKTSGVQERLSGPRVSLVSAASSTKKAASTNQITTVTANNLQTSSVTSDSKSVSLVPGSQKCFSDEECPQAKKTKKDGYDTESKNLKYGQDGTSMSSVDEALEEEKLNLQKELDRIRKEAEEYKAKLQLKEQEAEEYRQKLNEFLKK